MCSLYYVDIFLYFLLNHVLHDYVLDLIKSELKSMQVLMTIDMSK